MHYFSIYFNKMLKIKLAPFPRLDLICKLLGNSEKTLKTFDKDSQEKWNFNRISENSLLK